MMLYIDKNVEKLAEVANCPSDVVSRKVVEYIEDNGLIDCPECGGECEVIDGEYRTHQQDRDSEPETETIWEEKQCLSCGNRFYN